MLRERHSVGEAADSAKVDATVSRPTRRVSCPACGFEVTTRAKRRVRRLHHRPDGSVCPQERWDVDRTDAERAGVGPRSGMGKGSRRVGEPE